MRDKCKNYVALLAPIVLHDAHDAIVQVQCQGQHARQSRKIGAQQRHVEGWSSVAKFDVHSPLGRFGDNECHDVEYRDCAQCIKLGEKGGWL
jgi:hypothetical protein